MIVLQIIFWVCVALMGYSYLIYPVLLYLFSLNKKENTTVFKHEDELPVVCILISVHNEQEIIEKKLQSLDFQNYPKEKLFILIGSDSSTDDTEGIIKTYLLKNKNTFLHSFNDRRGKPGVINHLAELAKQYHPQVLVLTDANVIFNNDTVFELVKHFKNPHIGLVGSNVINSTTEIDGISKQEKTYIQGENRIKYLEGITWGTMMGAFGASYAVRANLYKPVKDNFNVDDFFITMNVLHSGSKAISNTNAICYEDVSNDIKEEFRRKKRIATGNYQNLAEFSSFILNPFKAIGFCFISHKLIRWLGPFLIVVLFISSGLLAIGNKFYLLLFSVQLLMLLTPVIDIVLKKINLHISLLRFVAYFYMMNIAVLAGFINYLNGIDSNAWTPTKRNA
jgi:cellulose synthase/poly-beta-1,6-N-acetylglucosamine synthase-like glycosyltransferase